MPTQLAADVQLPNGTEFNFTSYVAVNSRGVSVQLRGNGTSWTPESEGVCQSPVFTLAGGAAVIRSQRILNATLAVLTIDTGKVIDNLIFTDPSTGATASLYALNSFAQVMQHRYEELLLSSAGLTSVNVDGQSNTIAQLETWREYWARKVRREQGKRPKAFSINMDRFAC